jgi:hypothetical protein
MNRAIRVSTSPQMIFGGASNGSYTPKARGFGGSGLTTESHCAPARFLPPSMPGRLDRIPATHVPSTPLTVRSDNSAFPTRLRATTKPARENSQAEGEIHGWRERFTVGPKSV